VAAPSKPAEAAPSIPFDMPVAPESAAPTEPTEGFASVQPLEFEGSGASESDEGQSVVTRLPVLGGFAPRVTTAGTPLVLASAAGNEITVSATDGAPETVRITVLASRGTLSLARTVGVTVVAGRPASSSMLTVIGSAENITAALDGLTFVPEPHFVGEATICFDIGYAPAIAESLCIDPAGGGEADPAAGPRAVLSLPVTIKAAGEQRASSSPESGQEDGAVEDSASKPSQVGTAEGSD
jgi:hypothetical protein